ncbi:MAG: helix-turn-helix transcriptional regulator [Desulfomonilaceae bacterium]
MRGNQIARQWKIIRLMETRKQGMSGMGLARELGVPLRTVYRDLDAIHEAGFPLYPDRDGKNSVWKMLDTFRNGFSLPLTDAELMALKLSRDLLGIFEGTIFRDGIETLFQKVKSALLPETLTGLETFSGTLMTKLGPTNDLVALKNIMKGMGGTTASRETVKINHRSVQTG